MDMTNKQKKMWDVIEKATEKFLDLLWLGVKETSRSKRYG
jgi:hypothetical protein